MPVTHWYKDIKGLICASTSVISNMISMFVCMHAFLLLLQSMSVSSMLLLLVLVFYHGVFTSFPPPSLRENNVLPLFMCTLTKLNNVEACHGSRPINISLLLDHSSGLSHT